MDSGVLEWELQAVERVPAEGRSKPAQFIPIRLLFTNKLSKDDKLLLALDAFALSKSLGREVSVGRIIHGDDHATLKVKTSPMTSEEANRENRRAAGQSYAARSRFEPSLRWVRIPSPLQAEGGGEGRSQPGVEHARKRAHEAPR
jgi:hypothetical protein